MGVGEKGVGEQGISLKILTRSYDIIRLCMPMLLMRKPERRNTEQNAEQTRNGSNVVLRFSTSGWRQAISEL